MAKQVQSLTAPGAPGAAPASPARTVSGEPVTYIGSLGAVAFSDDAVPRPAPRAGGERAFPNAKRKNLMDGQGGGEGGGEVASGSDPAEAAHTGKPAGRKADMSTHLEILGA